VELAILGQVKATSDVSFPILFDFGPQPGYTLIPQVKHKNLVFVKDLHLVEKIFFNEFTVLFNYFKIRGRERFQLHGLELAIAVLYLSLDKHAILVPTEQSKLFSYLNGLLLRRKPTCPSKIT